jgi:hypothetical protein
MIGSRMPMPPMNDFGLFAIIIFFVDLVRIPVSHELLVDFIPNRMPLAIMHVIVHLSANFVFCEMYSSCFIFFPRSKSVSNYSCKTTKISNKLLLTTITSFGMFHVLLAQECNDRRLISSDFPGRDQFQS